MAKALLGLAALFLLASCTPGVQRSDPVVPLTVEGCKVERYVVTPNSNGGQEVVYVARCKPTETASVTTKVSCGRNCTRTVTTVTTVEGSPGASEIPVEKQ